MFEGPSLEAFVRVGGCADGRSVYLDLGNEEWEAVEITAAGWRIVESQTIPLRFRRSPHMLSIPIPSKGGRLDQLGDLLNLASEDQLILACGWLTGAIKPTGPYPVLCLHGEQGTAKSTNARMLKGLVDPSRAAIRAEPRSARDLAVAAQNTWILAYDNLSCIPPWLSDALCRLSTGGGFSTRALYTDAEEIIFDASRPVILNGISELATRSDLLDRSILMELPVISPEERREERVLWQRYDAARPQLLGALLDVVVAALRNDGRSELHVRPRLADFATWVAQGEPSTPWGQGAFAAAYGRGQREANILAMESSSVGRAVLCWVETVDLPWRGTASTLLGALLPHRLVREEETNWPESPRALAGELRRIAPNLRKEGLDLGFGTRAGGTGQRIIQVRRLFPPKSTRGEDLRDAARR